MSTISSKLARACRQPGSQITNTISAPQIRHRRSTSWIAWEQPNPALYAQPAKAPPSSEIQQSAMKTQDTRNVGETVTAPATTAVAGGSQEVSTSGKTTPSSIQAGSSRIPFSQTRSIQTQSQNNGLPTTLLRIPGVTSTWPAEKPSHPDQERVRKQVTVHENEGPSQEGTPKPKPKATLAQRNADAEFSYTPQSVLHTAERWLAVYDYSLEQAIRANMSQVQNKDELLQIMEEFRNYRIQTDEEDEKQ